MATEMTSNPIERNESLLKSAWMIAVVIVFSKLAGFFRDIVTANFYGAGLVSDAYFYAYQIPSLALILLGGVGGPFHSAVVSVFSKLIPSNALKADEKVNKLFNTCITASFIVFLVLGLLIFIFSDVIMGFIISKGSTQLIDIASQHLRIMTPVFVVGGLVGIYYGVLVSFKKFLIPNISPSLMSLAIIIVLSLCKQDEKGIMLAVATMIGGLAQFLFQLPKIKQLGFKFVPNLAIKNNIEFKNILELLFPAILSSTVGQVYIYVDMFFASSLQEGAWSAIGYANRVYQFPVGILVTAFLVPLFPLFSRLVADKDLDGVKYYFNKGVGLLNFACFPILIAIVLLAHDAIRFVFERGAFNANATLMVTEALLFLSVSLLPYVFRDSITRLYYAFNDSKTPFYVAFSSILLKVLLNWIMVPKLGIGGITLSTSLVTLWNAVILGVLIRKKIRLGMTKYFIDLMKLSLVAGITYCLSFVVYQGIKLLHLPLIINLFTMVGVIGIVYISFVLLFKIDYANELLERLKLKCKK